MAQDNSVVMVIDNVDPEELHRCLQYICLREGVSIEDGSRIEKMSITGVAEYYKVSRTTVYNWISKWENTGIMQKARDFLDGPRFEEIQVAYTEVMAAWPEIVRDAVQIATNAPSMRIRMEAKEWLYTRIVAAGLDKKQESGSGEMAYAGGNRDFDPTTVPSTLKINVSVSEVAQPAGAKKKQQKKQ